MSQFQVQVYNSVSSTGLDRFNTKQYNVGDNIDNPDVILCRSQKLHGLQPGENLKAVGRAGAGVNNIPVEQLNDHGIVVFRTPGANANAVKELVLAGLLVASRNICEAWAYTQNLTQTGAERASAVEAGKKQFVGSELPGKTIGIIGLGAIGRAVAETCIGLGMKVIGYDPMITVEGAWRLSASVQRASSVADVVKQSDYVSIHVPLTDDTRHMIDKSILDVARESLTLLNFSRDGIIDESALVDLLNARKIKRYVTDFPTDTVRDCEWVLPLPHLGASTREAEENCAVMVVDQVMDFLENGNIRNAVNFPDARMPRGSEYRLVVSNRNVPNMLGQISTSMADAGLNICDMLNVSRGELAYTIVDLDSPVTDSVFERVSGIDGVLNARRLEVLEL